jgi:hypothetical protein
MAGCAEMAQASAEHGMGSQDEADREGSCPDMNLDCLATNGLPPLALLGGSPMQAAPFPAAASYLNRDAVRLVSEPMRPESPPPQTSLTV